MISGIRILEVRKPYGDTESGNTTIMKVARSIIAETLVDFNLTKVTMVNWGGIDSGELKGNFPAKELLIVCNTTFDVDDGNLDHFYFDESCEPVAQYVHSKFKLIINYDIYEKNKAKAHDEFRAILKQFNDETLSKIEDPTSWRSVEGRKALVEEAIEGMTSGTARKIERYKRTILDNQERIKALKADILNAIDRIQETQSILVGFEEFTNNGKEKIASQLDMIANHPKIKNIYLRGGNITVVTNELILTNEGDKYKIGSFGIKLNLERSHVTFEGGIPRPSYWTRTDIHPHIAGDTGEACLGSAEPILAELFSQFELYAIIMICIDFLESVNTSDVAGKNVINWDRILDDGKISSAIIEEDEDEDEDDYRDEDDDEDDDDEDDDEECEICEICGNEITEGVHVFERVDEYVDYGPDGEPVISQRPGGTSHMVCMECLDPSLQVFHPQARCYVMRGE